MRAGLLIACLLVSRELAALSVTVSPIFPKAGQPLEITVDVTGTAYQGKTGDTYIWTWIPGATVINAPTNVSPATAAQAAAKWTRLSPDIYRITFTPTTFFQQPLASFSGNSIGFLLKATDWSGGQTQDLFVTFFQGFAVQFTQPTDSVFFVDNGEQIPITAYASETADLELKVNGTPIINQSGTSITTTHTVTETSGSVVVEFEATNATPATVTTSFTYIVRSATIPQPRPPGIIDGINYDADQTKVTLGLWAPGKSSVYLLGDFNDWEISPDYQMKQDGEHFWLELTGLTPGTEYAYQYLVDEDLRLADPYADKILDRYDDQYIPSTTYPSLKTYPVKAYSDKWYFNRAAVFQTGQTPYPWVVTNFIPPDQENLVIYELLIRDYFGSNNRNYQTLIDTLTYLKRLGVTAIELMPVTEFNGNDSWGYNPTFMFAPDKYYGTKNKLKEFIDVCHQNGMAVILDMVMNHHDTPNPYVMMDFDFNAFKPTANNKWFNVDAKHPFNVFFDMNHESLYTKAYLDTVNHYWLHEYKFDGFRYDLSKGFTQTNNPDNVNAWGLRDNSRIAIFKRMADKIWSHTPQAYVILEHFAENSEEKELAEYGMMLWGNLNYNYNQNTIGLTSNSDFNWIFHGSRTWNVPHVVGYMESHDEERMMYRNLTQGLGSSSYNVKDPTTAIERMKAINALFYTIPGPKMLWQFGELGYDVSIDFNGRVGAKPVKWEYLADPMRKKLNQVTELLIKLKQTYPIFQTTDVTFGGMATLQKQITLKAVPFTNNPASTSEMSAVVVGNFDITAKTLTVNFPHIGNWYHYYSGGDVLNVTNAATSITLQPGEARIYTNVTLPAPGVDEIIQFVRPIAPELLSVTEGDNAINLQWQDKSGIETGYNIWRRPLGGTFAKVGDEFRNLQFHIDYNALAPLTTYEYYVEAANTYGASSSNILTITTSDQITGLESEWRGVRVYPNPSNGVVTIDVPPALADARWTVKNALGQTLSVPSPRENTLDLSQQPAGLYLVVISSGDQSRAFKVLKR
jgi:1,4-alpha-glucan branching enzyme